MELEKLVETCTQGFVQLTNALGGRAEGALSYTDAAKSFRRLADGSDSDSVQTRLGLNKSERGEFYAAIRDLDTRLKRPSIDTQSKRNTLIAALRLIGWLSSISKNVPQLVPVLQSTTDDFAENRGRKQLRAAELVIRSVIAERYENQEDLLTNIRAYLKLSEPQIEAIKNRGNSGDILSGTEFGQLASLFIQKDEFASRYSFLYENSPFLSFLREKQETLRLFLDDMRRVRNQLAHHRQLTAGQLELLDLYYEEIIEPIQRAHDEGRVKVNPEEHLDASKEELKEYLDALHEDVNEVNENLKKVVQGIDVIDGKVNWLKRHTRWVVAGVAAIVVMSAFILKSTELGRQATLEVKQDTTEIKAGVNKVDRAVTAIDSKLDTVKKETSDDPRKELANLGVAWSVEKFNEALIQNDVRTASLFVAGKLDLQTKEAKRYVSYHLFGNNDDFERHLPMIAEMKRLGVDFIKDYVPSTIEKGCPYLDSPLNSSVGGVPKSDNKRLKWLLENNDTKSLDKYACIAVNFANSCDSFRPEQYQEDLLGAPIMMLVRSGLPLDMALAAIETKLVQLNELQDGLTKERERQAKRRQSMTAGERQNDDFVRSFQHNRVTVETTSEQIRQCKARENWLRNLAKR